jgi:tRNA A-37 threonylcarbamoyl transferase component Bud32
MKLAKIFQYEKVIMPREWRNALHRWGLDDFGEIYGLRGGVVVAESRTTSVLRFSLRNDDACLVLYVKKYWFTEPGGLWKSMFRGTFFGRSKVKREYRFLRQLQRHGVAAATPVAYGEQRVARWLYRSFLVTEEIPEPQPLDQLISQTLFELSKPARRRAHRMLIESLAVWLSAFHTEGFVHHDLYWRNLIVSRGDWDRFIVIDAPKGRRWWPGEERRCRTRDLATLDAPAPLYFRRTERLRFLLSYLGERRLNPSVKNLARAVLMRAEGERARQTRRIREMNQGLVNRASTP